MKSTLVVLVVIGCAIAFCGASAGSPAAAQTSRAEKQREGLVPKLHPGALARLIDELGGREIMLPAARVVAVLNPRAFLIESPSELPGAIVNIDRVLVLVDAGSLRVETAAILDSNVKVLGTARTLLGVQTTAEVPWPPELTREVLKRYAIRAAVLARSVQTADGVELTDRRTP